MPIDPKLGPLADNGGPTQTHALLAGSPAIGTGNAAAMAGVGDVPLFDQRGAPYGRVVGSRIDIGAFEFRLPGDFNGDGIVNALDIDLLAIEASKPQPSNLFYDLNDDGEVTYVVSAPGSIVHDSDVLIRTILQTDYGDLNLDRQVFLSDLNTFATHYRQAGKWGWANGNINGSQEEGTTASPRVFLADLNALATNWRFGVGSASFIDDALSGSSAGSDMAMPQAPEAARAAAIVLIEAPSGQDDPASRSRSVFHPACRAQFDGDDLLLLAQSRVGRSTPQMVTSTADHDTSGTHSDDDTGLLTDDPLAVALESWPGAKRLAIGVARCPTSLSQGEPFAVHWPGSATSTGTQAKTSHRCYF
jgi:hypothetical protein